MCLAAIKCFRDDQHLFTDLPGIQVGAILAAMTFVRFGLEPLMRCIRSLFRAPGAWEKSPEHYILREVGRASHRWIRLSLSLPFGMSCRA